ncbi:FeoA family protein [Ignatzschineria cameli]|uniref:FeoA family protein n=1 Tax=Ignatzschineria cameli TaxID=2182793 RepID=UPI000D606D73|nr:FeoA family protein [Ignatzschineria cameli]PWD85322.1 ferrous iron transport protein A [Ignatzschineria cameli]
MSQEQVLALNQLQREERAIIKAVHTDGALRQKFFNMGFIPGAEVFMVRSAPLLDPLEVEILGYFVTLRREEAEKIEIERVGQ